MCTRKESNNTYDYVIINVIVQLYRETAQNADSMQGAFQGHLQLILELGFT